jgi:signal transduction histidine kinase/CheY-like chemotaxis protein
VLRLGPGGGGEPDSFLSTHIAATPSGGIWISGTHGLRAWHAELARFLPIPGSPPGFVVGFAFQSRDIVWLHHAGRIEGYRWNGSVLERFHQAGAADGIPAVTPSGVLADSVGNVWLTTARGLIKYAPASRHTRIFGKGDGLLSPEFDSQPPLMTRDGTVFASTMNGIVVFQPSKVGVVSQPAELTWDALALRRGDERLAMPSNVDGLTLQPGDRDLRVTMRVRSLADRSTVHFRTRLRGYDKAWNDDDDGERVFTKLEPGHYTLEAIAANADGIWSAPRRLEIEVLPPWWQTLWARLAFAGTALLLIFAVAAAYRARLRRIHHANLLEERRLIAERNSEAKSRFLANLSHEIRTPMTGVLGMAELLQADALDERQRARVDAIQGAGQHLLRLVNDALDLARIEAGRLELHETAFDLHRLVAEVSALLRPQAEAKGLAFSEELDPDAPRGLRGDAVRIRQILLNLGHNAVKFTERGAVALRVGPGDSCGVVLEVRDTGPGLDAGQQARLFRRFEQADGARTASRYGGSGLGLSICQELAHAMGGSLGVDSEPGRGATFRVHLPLPIAVLHDPVSPRHVREAIAGARILLVEDDAVVAEVVRDMLTAHGHHVVHAAHGLAALAEAAGARFDIALLDLDLPGLDGMELARLLHAQMPDLPLVAVTARADGEAEPDARAAGMVGFLRKPVTGDALAALVDGHARREPREVEFLDA